MNTFSCIARAAVQFQNRLLAVPSVIHHPISLEIDYKGTLLWNNLLISSPIFRYGHVETFEVPGRMSILHVCIFPHLDDASPIFGFDMIAGSSKVTGIFLDLSSTTDDLPFPRLRNIVDSLTLNAFSVRRSLPEWGEIFSPDILAIRPSNLKEVKIAISVGHQVLDNLLSQPRVKSHSLTAAIHAGQRRYVDAQRQNDRTFQLLTGFIGKVRARQFIDEILFPSVPTLS